MFPWMFSSNTNPWKLFFEGPLSGNVDQDFLNGLQLFSPVINIKGDAEIESKIISEVASYGKQLGILAEAVLELEQGKPGDAIKRLKEQVNTIEAIKKEHKKDSKKQAELALSKLTADDLKDVLQKFT